MAAFDIDRAEKNLERENGAAGVDHPPHGPEHFGRRRRLDPFRRVLTLSSNADPLNPSGFGQRLIGRGVGRTGGADAGWGLRPSRADPHPAKDQDDPHGCHKEHGLRGQLVYPIKSARKHTATLPHRQTYSILNSTVWLSGQQVLFVKPSNI